MQCSCLTDLCAILVWFLCFWCYYCCYLFRNCSDNKEFICFCEILWLLFFQKSVFIYALTRARFNCKVFWTLLYIYHHSTQILNFIMNWIILDIFHLNCCTEKSYNLCSETIQMTYKYILKFVCKSFCLIGCNMRNCLCGWNSCEWHYQWLPPFVNINWHLWVC